MLKEQPAARAQCRWKEAGQRSTRQPRVAPRSPQPEHLDAGAQGGSEVVERQENVGHCDHLAIAGEHGNSLEPRPRPLEEGNQGKAAES